MECGPFLRSERALEFLRALCPVLDVVVSSQGWLDIKYMFLHSSRELRLRLFLCNNETEEKALPSRQQDPLFSLFKCWYRYHLFVKSQIKALTGPLPYSTIHLFRPTEYWGVFSQRESNLFNSYYGLSIITNNALNSINGQRIVRSSNASNYVFKVITLCG